MSTAILHTVIDVDGLEQTVLDTPWPGFTAASLRSHWIKRLRDASRDFTKDGDAITVTSDNRGFTETVTRTFRDSDALFEVAS